MLELAKEVLPKVGHAANYQFTIDLHENYVEVLGKNVLIHEALRTGKTIRSFQLKYEGRW